MQAGGIHRAAEMAKSLGARRSGEGGLDCECKK